MDKGCDDLGREISLKEFNLVLWVVSEGHQRRYLLILVVHQIDDVFFYHSDFIIALQ